MPYLEAIPLHSDRIFVGASCPFLRLVPKPFASSFGDAGAFGHTRVPVWQFAGLCDFGLGEPQEPDTIASLEP